MLFLLSFLVLLIAPIFQIIFGNKTRSLKIKLSYLVICILTSIVHFIFTITSFFLAINAITSNGNKCATGAIGMFLISFMIWLSMILTIIFQIFTGRYKSI